METVCKPITMTAWFQMPEGRDRMSVDINKVQPIKFGIDTEEGEPIEVKIMGIVKREKQEKGKEVILKFVCNVVMCERKRQCEIWGYVNGVNNGVKWVLQKI